MELTSHHNQKSWGKVRRHHTSDHFPESFFLASILLEQCLSHQEGPWVRMIGQRQPVNLSYHLKTPDCEPHGRAVLGFLTLLLSTQMPLPNHLLLSQFMRVLGQFIWVLDKSPLSELGRDSTSCNIKRCGFPVLFSIFIASASELVLAIGKALNTSLTNNKLSGTRMRMISENKFDKYQRSMSEFYLSSTNSLVGSNYHSFLCKRVTYYSFVPID